jgi:hypothetical protein
MDMVYTQRSRIVADAEVVILVIMDMVYTLRMRDLDHDAVVILVIMDMVYTVKSVKCYISVINSGNLF